MSNQITQAQRPKFSALIATNAYQTTINNTLRDPKRAQRFVAAITSAVATNPALQDCDPATVLSGALLGESLGLSPSPQLGQYYLVPFRNSKKGCTDAQFCLGYKGYGQLALRSGYYKHLSVLAVKDGELTSWNPLTEELVLDIIPDEETREKAPTIGYAAEFEYLNGFRKTIYWSYSKMVRHAERYSKGYAARKGYTFWERDFDAMAYKTMLRQLISKWGVMSIDLQTALENDMAEPEPAGTYLPDDSGAELPPPGQQAAQTEPADQPTAEEPPEEEQVNLDEV